MANTLGIYDPIFYANEALIHLENNLGMAGRVHRGFEAERNSFEKGSVINIRKPSTFTAANAPATAADITTETIAMTLNQWKEVKFKLTDKELAFTQQRIIDDHIRPAAYALANELDQQLCALYKQIPWYFDLNSTPGSVVADATGPRKILVNNKVPMSQLHYAMDGTTEQGFLGLAAFTQQQGAGEAGVRAQMAGSLGTRYGMEFFTDQNIKTHTAGAITSTAPITNGAVAIGDTSIAIDEASLTGTVVEGDILEFAGITQKYAVTAAATASGNAITCLVTPAFKTVIADGVAVTFEQTSAQQMNLAFHRNAFALIIAPLPDRLPNELGAKVATVTDPNSGISIRSRIYYVGNSSEVHVALDILFAVKTIEENLACRARD